MNGVEESEKHCYPSTNFSQVSNCVVHIIIDISTTGTIIFFSLNKMTVPVVETFLIILLQRGRNLREILSCNSPVTTFNLNCYLYSFTLYDITLTVIHLVLFPQFLSYTLSLMTYHQSFHIVLLIIEDLLFLLKKSSLLA